MELTFDRGIYSDAVLSTAAYWLSGEYAVERTLEGSTEVWKITRADAAPFDEAELRARLLRELNDQKLREIIKSETKDIRTILYAKAFADCDDLTEEDLSL
ncbi:MAG: His-Xaa-Ser system protein HxsD [Succinivibrionaceae bacterium]|nr:His-Xaa-Ser system protein HxsD [Succinivibrionaceae bacterium]